MAAQLILRGFWNAAVAGGYLLYARKQREIPPLIGGVVMMAVSFMVTSWFTMAGLASLSKQAGVLIRPFVIRQV